MTLVSCLLRNRLGHIQDVAKVFVVLLEMMRIHPLPLQEIRDDSLGIQRMLRMIDLVVIVFMPLRYINRMSPAKNDRILHAQLLTVLIARA